MTRPLEIAPFSFDAFRAALNALKPPQRFAIAVSGGRDSMALAMMISQYIKEEGASAVAVTVDHGLRATSQTEAQRVAQWCRALSFDHVILRWQGDKPLSGIQERARQARYALMCDFCEAEGFSTLLTAHTATDQAETFMMRLSRDAGVRGLGAMAPETMIAAGAGPEVRLLRPMLEFSREQVSATVRAAGQPFVDDPSNEDMSFERVRVRKKLSAFAETDALSVQNLCTQAAKMRRLAGYVAKREEILFDALSGAIHEWGGVTFDAPDLSDEETTSLIGGLASRLIAAVAGRSYLPAPDTAETALSQAMEKGTATLGGAIWRRKQGRIYVMREPAAVLGRAGVSPLGEKRLVPGERHLFDGRFVIENRTSDAVIVRPLGEDLALLDPAFFGDVPREALATLPAVFQKGVLIAHGAGKGTKNTDRNVAIHSITKRQFQRQVIRFEKI